MKRISTALVAAAMATGLAITPAVAQDAPETGASKNSIEATSGNVGNNEDETQDEGKTNPQPSKRGSTTGSAVGASVGILSALVTAALIVFSNPKGIDKAIDLLNANFGLGLPKFGF